MLLVGAGDAVKVGAPLVSGAKVKGTVVAHGRGDKVKIFKLRRRKHFQKTQGHRQNYTEVRIDDIARSKSHGTQESRRQLAQRARLASQSDSA